MRFFISYLLSKQVLVCRSFVGLILSLGLEGHRVGSGCGKREEVLRKRLNESVPSKGKGVGGVLGPVNLHKDRGRGDVRDFRP